MLMLVAVFALPVSSLNAQTIPAFEDIKSQADLDKAAAALDAALFDAYNRCDLARFSSFLDDHVEFYHDRGGVTLGKDKLTDSVKNNICGGDVRRELVPDTLRNYHMDRYGILQMGVHRFYHPKSNGPTGEGSFITLWQYEHGAWKITRAISYDHQLAAN